MKTEDSEKKATELGIAVTETAIDLVTKLIPELEKAVSPIPVIGAGIKLVQTIRDESFLRKLKMFVKQLENLNQKEIEDFTKKLEEEPTEFAKKIILVIDRIDEEEKAIIIGNLTNARIKFKLTEEEYTRLVSVVNRSYLQDIKYLFLSSTFGANVPSDNKLDFQKHIDVNVMKTNLFSVGLLKQKIVEDKNKNYAMKKYISKNSPQESKTTYDTTTIGYKLAQYGFSNITYTS